MTQLALIIDLDSCVGCHACVVSCNEWNAADIGYIADNPNSLNKNQANAAFNQVQTYEVGTFPNHETVHFPNNCLHCENPPCVPVCPTGASFKRELDGIVLVDYDKCIGCEYCVWACPYGARAIDTQQKVAKKCTLCVDRLYDQSLPENLRKPSCVLVCPTEARLFGDIHDTSSDISKKLEQQSSLHPMPEWGAKPASSYLYRHKGSNKLED
jgi:Fe-S-cluster-containing dehydrogenase component